MALRLFIKYISYWNTSIRLCNNILHTFLLSYIHVGNIYKKNVNGSLMGTDLKPNTHRAGIYATVVSLPIKSTNENDCSTLFCTTQVNISYLCLANSI